MILSVSSASSIGQDALGFAADMAREALDLQRVLIDGLKHKRRTSLRTSFRSSAIAPVWLTGCSQYDEPSLAPRSTGYQRDQLIVNSMRKISGLVHSGSCSTS
jgi:hypothetical protein